MSTPHLKMTFRGRKFELCYLGFVSNPPSSLLTSVVADEQGVVGGESVDGTDRMSDSMVNDPLFCGGGSCAERLRRAEWMRLALVYIRGRCRQSERPEEKVSRHTVRPGTQGRTLGLRFN